MQPIVNNQLGGKIDSYGADTEVIIIVRSKSAPQLGESITIDEPTQQLIEYLGEMKRGAESRCVDMARVRKASEDPDSHSRR